MKIEEAARIVSEWAKEKPQILTVQFFGSRVKGTDREDSDLDVAIKLIPNLDESGGFSTWVRFADQWNTELNQLLPLKVQAEWNNGDGTSIILSGLFEASVLVYEKEI